MAHSRAEPFVQAIHDRADEANIERNDFSELLAFRDAIWQQQWCTLMNPELASSEPHTFEWTRKRWGLTVRLWYWDTSCTGDPRREIHLSVKSKNHQAVREFAEATELSSLKKGEMWSGSLHFDGNRSCAPLFSSDTYPAKAIFHLVCEARNREKAAEEAKKKAAEKLIAAT